MRKYYVLKPFVYNGKSYKYGDIFDADALKMPDIKVQNRIKARMLTLSEIKPKGSVKVEQPKEEVQVETNAEETVKDTETEVKVEETVVDPIFENVSTANKKNKNK